MSTPLYLDIAKPVCSKSSSLNSPRSSSPNKFTPIFRPIHANSVRSALKKIPSIHVCALIFDAAIFRGNSSYTIIIWANGRCSQHSVSATIENLLYRNAVSRLRHSWRNSVSYVDSRWCQSSLHMFSVWMWIHATRWLDICQHIEWFAADNHFAQFHFNVYLVKHDATVS